MKEKLLNPINLPIENLSGLSEWYVELERGGRVEARAGKLIIDVPAGASIWYLRLLRGPVSIRYDATVIARGGSNDRVSDLNCFWMATDARAEDGDFFGVTRSGAFPDYNRLRCYYVGHGGNNNSTTRFRRYIGDQEIRPLLPEHDLHENRVLLEPNRTYRIELIADGGRIQYRCDGELIFDFRDDAPYTEGYFGLRTVRNHMQIESFRVVDLDGGTRDAGEVN